MAQDESHWIGRAQDAEALLGTKQAVVDSLKEKIREIKGRLGARERSDGTIDFDWDVLVKQLSMESALELRAIIDEVHRISGAPGEKPRVRMPAQAAAG